MLEICSCFVPQHICIAIHTINAIWKKFIDAAASWHSALTYGGLANYSALLWVYSVSCSHWESNLALPGSGPLSQWPWMWRGLVACDSFHVTKYVRIIMAPTTAVVTSILASVGRFPKSLVLITAEHVSFWIVLAVVALCRLESSRLGTPVKATLPQSLVRAHTSLVLLC